MQKSNIENEEEANDTQAALVKDRDTRKLEEGRRGKRVTATDCVELAAGDSASVFSDDHGSHRPSRGMLGVASASLESLPDAETPRKSPCLPKRPSEASSLKFSPGKQLPQATAASPLIDTLETASVVSAADSDSLRRKRLTSWKSRMATDLAASNASSVGDKHEHDAAAPEPAGSADAAAAHSKGRRPKRNKGDPMSIVAGAEEVLTVTQTKFSAEMLWAGEHRPREITAAVSRLSAHSHACSAIPKTEPVAAQAAELASSLFAAKESIEALRTCFSGVRTSPWKLVETLDDKLKGVLVSLRPELLMAILSTVGEQTIDKALDDPSIIPSALSVMRAGKRGTGLCVGLLLEAQDRPDVRLELAEQAQKSLALYFGNKLFGGKIAQSRLVGYYESMLECGQQSDGLDFALQRFSDGAPAFFEDTGLFAQAQYDILFIKLLLCALMHLEHEKPFPTDLRRLAQALTAKPCFDKISLQLRAMCSIIASHGRLGLAKKAMEEVKKAGQTVLPVELEHQNGEAAIMILRKLPAIPESTAEAYDTVIDWYDQHSEQLVGVHKTHTALLGSKVSARLASVTRERFQDLYAAVTKNFDEAQILTLLSRVYSGDDVSALEDEVGLLNWLKVGMAMLSVLADIAYGESLPTEFKGLRTVGLRLEVVSEAIDLINTEVIDQTAKLTSWKELLDKEKAQEDLMDKLAPQQGAAQGPEADSLCSKLSSYLRQGSITGPMSSYVIGVAAREPTDTFVATAESFQDLMSPQARLALQKTHTQKQVMEAKKVFSMGGRIGVLQLANILHKLHEEHQTSQGYVPDKLLVEKFEAAFNDLLEKVTYAEGARLYDKYKCVLAAATHGWDFSQAKRYIYEDCKDPNVEADVKVMELMCQEQGTTTRILEGLSLVLDFQPDKLTVVTSQLKIFADTKEKLEQIPILLAVMVLCSLLVLPATATNKLSLKAALAYVEKKAHVPKATLPAEVQKRIHAFESAVTSVPSGADSAADTAAPAEPAQKKAKVTCLKKKGA